MRSLILASTLLMGLAAPLSAEECVTYEAFTTASADAIRSMGGKSLSASFNEQQTIAFYDAGKAIDIIPDHVEIPDLISVHIWKDVPGKFDAAMIVLYDSNGCMVGALTPPLADIRRIIPSMVLDPPPLTPASYT